MHLCNVCVYRTPYASPADASSFFRSCADSLADDFCAGDCYAGDCYADKYGKGHGADTACVHVCSRGLVRAFRACLRACVRLFVCACVCACTCACVRACDDDDDGNHDVAYLPRATNTRAGSADGFPDVGGDVGANSAGASRSVSLGGPGAV